MLPFDDARWPLLHGGYRIPYDPRPALRQLRSDGGAEQAWLELWEGLHHQGDVDVASYAAVPHLVRLHAEHQVSCTASWNTYGLLSVIEWERHRDGNPPVPDWLLAGYLDAWRAVGNLALRDLVKCSDKDLIRCAISALATSRGMPVAGRVIFNNSEDELQQLGQGLL